MLDVSGRSVEVTPVMLVCQWYSRHICVFGRSVELTSIMLVCH